MTNLRKLAGNENQILKGIQKIRATNTIENILDDDEIANFFGFSDQFVKINYGTEIVTEICDFFLKNEFQKELFRFNEYFQQNCETIQTREQKRNDNKKLDIFECSQGITNFLLAYSKAFINSFFESDFGFKYLVSLIDNMIFQNNFHDYDVFYTILSNISLLCTDSVHINQVRESKLIDILSEITEKYPNLKQISYGCILRVADDNLINGISNLSEILTTFEEKLTTASKDIDYHGTNLNREKMDYYADNRKDIKTYDAYCISDHCDKNSKISIVTIMHILAKASIIERIKFEIYEKTHNAIKIIIEKGSELEIRFALKLLTQLCFDAKVVESVLKDKDLVDRITALFKNDHVMKRIREYSERILFSLHNNIVEKIPVRDANDGTIRLMISYNSGTRDLCIKVRDYLETNGYRVWIDINEIHGPSIDSMAQAIEQSHIILMCVTEGYRQSSYCRSEATYARIRGKKIIPLIMQKDYQNVSGWLGFIMADLLYVNFMKQDFDKTMKALIHQIDLNLKDETIQKNQTKGGRLAAKVTAHKWTENEVETWFKNENLEKVHEYIKPCDGSLLEELREMQKAAPEYFYQFISFNNRLEPRNVLLFSKKLKILFHHT